MVLPLIDTSSLNYMFISMRRPLKKAVMVLADIIALQMALWSAFALRLSEWWPSEYLYPAWPIFVITPIIGVFIFIRLGLYRAVVRFMGLKVLQAVATGVFLLVFFQYAATVVFSITPFPRSIPIIFGLAAWLYLGGSRLLIRSYYHWLISNVISKKPVIIYGAGGAGAQLAQLLHGGGDYVPVGFIDDDESLHGSSINGFRVYPPNDLEKLVDEHKVGFVLLALPNVSSEQRRIILNQVSDLPVQVKTMPSMPEIIAGEAIDSLRQVEIEDLLGRDSVHPIKELVDTSLKNKSVFVTGAGGSIGSEISRQAVVNGASRVILYDLSESSLYEIEQELVSSIEFVGDTEIVAVIGSVLDKDRLEKLFKKFKVDTVYHAAAYKHVPLVEQNVIQGVRNNSLGTKMAAEAAIGACVERFVLISTDKAVRPTNVMGATKRLAELVLQDLSSDPKNKTVFSMVRFGNVLGSSGSVVPLFKKQIEQGGPITVTHPDITRYFMTIPEASSLVIQAGSLAKGGEVFILDMGEPVKISELADKMVRLSGLTVKNENTPKGDIDVVYTGLRPGEKLYEELLIGLNTESTMHKKILSAVEEKLSSVELENLISQIEESIVNNDSNALRSLLKLAVSGYQPSVVNIDWLNGEVEVISQSSLKIH